MARFPFIFRLLYGAVPDFVRICWNFAMTYTCKSLLLIAVSLSAPTPPPLNRQKDLQTRTGILSGALVCGTHSNGLNTSRYVSLARGRPIIMHEGSRMLCRSWQKLTAVLICTLAALAAEAEEPGLPNTTRLKDQNAEIKSLETVSSMTR